MAGHAHTTYRINEKGTYLFWLAPVPVVAGLVAALALQSAIPLLVLAVLAAVWLGAVIPVGWWMYAVAFLIPFSTDIAVAGGIHMDLPTEALLVAVTLAAVVLWARRGFAVKEASLRSPVFFFLMIWLIWTGITALFAEYPLISVKYLAAKVWYIVPFFFLPALLRWKDSDVRRFFDCLLLGAFLAALYFFINHAAEGLSFDSRTNAGQPIFRNHVNYACLLVLCLPVVWYRWRTAEKRKGMYVALGVVFLIFIYFSYARVAYLCLAFYAAGWVLVSWRLMKTAVVMAVMALVIFGAYLLHNNQYLDLAPDYDRAITQQRFDRLLSATYKKEDISSMERLYRWVAGIRMTAERPITGFGPANFYESYRPYTLTTFQTYVSDNPDRSGVHNYFLMLAAEQGLPGVFWFVALLLAALFRAQRLLYEKTGAHERLLIWLALMLVLGVVAINSINDMIEVIKVGPFFFFALYLLESRDRDRPADLGHINP